MTKLTLDQTLLVEFAARSGRLLHIPPDGLCLDGPGVKDIPLADPEAGQLGTTVRLHPRAGNTTYFQVDRLLLTGNHLVAVGAEVEGDNFDAVRGPLYVVALR